MYLAVSLQVYYVSLINFPVQEGHSDSIDSISIYLQSPFVYTTYSSPFVYTTYSSPFVYTTYSSPFVYTTYSSPFVYTTYSSPFVYTTYSSPFVYTTYSSPFVYTTYSSPFVYTTYSSPFVYTTYSSPFVYTTYSSPFVYTTYSSPFVYTTYSSHLYILLTAPHLYILLTAPHFLTGPHFTCLLQSALHCNRNKHTQTYRQRVDVAVNRLPMSVSPVPVTYVKWRQTTPARSPCPKVEVDVGGVYICYQHTLRSHHRSWGKEQSYRWKTSKTQENAGRNNNKYIVRRISWTLGKLFFYKMVAFFLGYILFGGGVVC